MKTKKIKSWAMACIAVAAFSVNASAWKIISREAIHGGFFGYDYVSWKLVNYPCSDGTMNCRGAEVKCYDPGWSHCPRNNAGMVTPEPPGESFDAVDITQSDALMDYALNEIAGGHLNGSHTITVSVVAPDGTQSFRSYLVTWNSEETEAYSSLIEVFRDDLENVTPTGN